MCKQNLFLPGSSFWTRKATVLLYQLPPRIKLASADDELTFVLPEPSSSYVPGRDDDLDFFFEDPEFHLVPECSLFNGCDCAYLKYSFTPAEVVPPVEGEEVGVLDAAITPNQAEKPYVRDTTFLDNLVADDDSCSCSGNDLVSEVVADDDSCSCSGDALVSEVVVDDDVSLSIDLCSPCETERFDSLYDKDTEMLSFPGSVSKIDGETYSFFGGCWTPPATELRLTGTENRWQPTSDMSLCEPCSSSSRDSAEDMDMDRSVFDSSTAVRYSSSGIDESYAFFGTDSIVKAGTQSSVGIGGFSLYTRASFIKAVAAMDTTDRDEPDIMDTTSIESEKLTPFHMVASAPAVKYTRASIFEDDEDDEE
ncbi:hypothetical protein INT48_009650 [Thamnidium elegans]|uniref:Uncharacterized protein n=1 Tax=Thamnidium elegans TaxID=101142 RepID=A0A8H7W015_9FUNG|nr:hypothetical protein INT48_009650 [Thamnidium elegans]